MCSYCLTGQATETQRLIYTSKRGKTREGLGGNMDAYFPQTKWSEKHIFKFLMRKMKKTYGYFVTRYMRKLCVNDFSSNKFVFKSKNKSNLI